MTGIVISKHNLHNLSNVSHVSNKYILLITLCEGCSESNAICPFPWKLKQIQGAQ